MHRLLSASLVLLVKFIAAFITQGVLAASVEFTECEIGDSASGVVIKAECSTVSVAENPKATAGRQIDLFIARLPAKARDSRDDPLTIIAGGPGQSAAESFPTVAPAFEKLRKNRDIYLIDQRGTGQSNKLDCPKDSGITDPFKFDADLIQQASKTCLDALEADPRYYSTSIAVRDLETVRQQLNIAQWNIYGVSYGTRVALHYLRLYPDSVRTMILDAVVPPELALGANIAIDAQRALDLMLERCENSLDCSGQFPDLRRVTLDLLQSLKEQPRSIQFENFNTGKLEQMEFSYNHLALTMRMLSYSSHGVSLLPVLLNDAWKNSNFAPLARQSFLQAKKIGDSLATGMHNAVVCTEDEPFTVVYDRLRTELGQTYLGTDAVDALASSCREWPAGVIDDNFKQPVSSEKPVLILSGEADPVTPPAYGESVASHLPKSLHIINPGQGHMQAFLGCMPTVLSNFIERGNTEDVDFGCLERVKPEPFFVDANGPMP